MGQRGPLPVADNVRQLRGTSRADRAQRNPKPVAGAPSQPRWLDAEAKAEWKRITPELERLGLLATIDRGVLTAYCVAWSAYVKAAKAVMGDFDVTAEGRERTVKKNPAWTVYQQAEAKLLPLLKELALTPNARLRIKLPDAEDEPDELLD